MSKKSLIIANWKMNLSFEETIRLARQIKKKTRKLRSLELVISPSFTALLKVAKLLKRSHIKLGAQDVFWESRGAYTGEISPTQLKELGIEYCLVGHSERRQYLGETNEMVAKKVKTLLEERLIPIICVGETFEERQEGRKDFIVSDQVSKALEDVPYSIKQPLIIAYEPVWVIGSGQAVEPFEAEETHRVIRQTLIDLFPDDFVKQYCRIIYGGSVDSIVIHDFIEKPTVDGVLVGGASLEIGEFVDLLKAVSD